MFTKAKYFSILISFIAIFCQQTYSQITITADGDQIYCPLSPINIVTDFTITDATSQINALYIQISTGYVQGEDTLALTGTHPNISDSWNTTEGKLILTWSGSLPVNYTELINAVKAVEFQSSSSTPSDKSFSITISDANYLPSTGHFYQYISSPGITWTDAKIAAESLDYYGLQGYLATITSADEAQLSGEQAAGAGWIGGSDSETEGVWKWVTGPENGMVFWNGTVNGSSPSGVYSNWNANEPNQLGNEDYAHVTAPGVGNPGSWNDLSNTGESSGDYQPKGYIVEYGGMPGDPTVNLSAFTTISSNYIESSTGDTVCGSGSVTLSAVASIGDVLWFDSETSVTPLHNGTEYTPIVSETTIYYALASVNGCLTGERTPVVVTVNPLPVIETNIIFKNCDEDGTPDGFTDFNLNEVNTLISNDASNPITYHGLLTEAESGENPIDPSSYNNLMGNKVYARVENSYGCYQISNITLDVTTSSFPTGFTDALTECDDDGTIDGYHEFDLTQAVTTLKNKFTNPVNIYFFRNLDDARLEQNEIDSGASFLNETIDSQFLYVRVESTTNGDCIGIGPHLQLIVQPIPDFEVTPTAMVCLNLLPITIEAINPKDDYTYLWTDENNTIISTQINATISKGGIYTVTATSLNCESFPQTVMVEESIIANITLEDIIIIDDSENNSIQINNQLGIGDYEFALDEELGIYQDEPYFDNLAPGIHTLFIRDKNNCGTAQIDVPVLGFPKFFTPNNDHFNDLWKVKGVSADTFKNTPIYIFNRFGKIIAVFDLLSNGWDGYYNGKVVPSGDYWFKVQLTDLNENTVDKKGHFSLIRK